MCSSIPPKLSSTHATVLQAPVHLFCGIWGLIATGLFTTREGWDLTYGSFAGDSAEEERRSTECCGLFYGCGFNLLAANLALMCTILAWVGGTSIILFYTIEVTLPRPTLFLFVFTAVAMPQLWGGMLFTPLLGIQPVVCVVCVKSLLLRYWAGRMAFVCVVCATSLQRVCGTAAFFTLEVDLVGSVSVFGSVRGASNPASHLPALTACLFPGLWPLCVRWGNKTFF